MARAQKVLAQSHRIASFALRSTSTLTSTLLQITHKSTQPVIAFAQAPSTKQSTMSLEAPPPSRPISSVPISQSTASRILDAYLSNSEAHAHLHPDALITPTGVTFSSHGGPMGGVVMHNLRRVAAGLRGEYLEPEKTPEPEGEEGIAGAEVGGKGGAGVKGVNKKTRKGGEEGWLDAEVAAEQGDGLVTGDVGDRTNGVVDGGEEPEVQVTGEKRKAAGESGDGKMSKEARKKAKKERDLQRKRDKEAQKAAKED
ncbi:hypothetical protein NX059_007337 [Plenodomus lindquistii]|nr:hypothetical protein NX059_007337 [Plenodomus lindquistii]